MNKERIEQLALEVAGAVSAPFISDSSLILFATRFLARVDAERAKEGSVVWRHTSEQCGSCVDTDSAQLLGWTTEPLSLLPQPTPEGYKLVPIESNEELREKVRDAVVQAIGGDAYDCTRVWSAWGYGTMDEDDFVPIVEQEERTAEIADAAYEAMLAATEVRP